MKLYLVQHGNALGKEIDPLRPLSPAGEADAGRMAAFLAQAGVRVVRLLHSGKTRAQQTAAILARSVLPEGAAAAAADNLAPNDALDPVLHDCAAWGEDTMLVGHLPYMAKLAAQLLTGQHTRAVVNFSPGTVVCLERGDDGAWTLQWALPPACL